MKHAARHARRKPGAEAPAIAAAPFAGALLAAALLAGCSSDAPGLRPDPVPGPGDFERSILSGGRTRSYLLHVPPAVDSGGPLPLVLAFHGAPSSAEEIRAISALDLIADRRGFAVAYPQASFTDWSLGCALCGSLAFELGIDDVRFVRDLIERISADLPIDSSRIYAAGFSNGALFTFRLACEASDVLAGFAAVGATMLEPDKVPPCDPPRAAPIVLFHGTADPSFPPAGRSFVSGVRTLSVERTVAEWAERNDCSPSPIVAPLADRVDDGTTARREEYVGCAADVVFYAIEGGGHTWPGSPIQFSSPLGPPSRDVDASQTIVDFFLNHAL